MKTWLASLGARRAGALTAAAIALLWTPIAIPGLLRRPDPDVAVFDPITPAFLTVVPLVAVLAYFLAPRLLRMSTRRATFVTACSVVITNALLVSEVIVLPGVTTTIGVNQVLWLVSAFVIGAPVMALSGLLYLGLPALIPASISAWVWLRAMRSVFQPVREPGQAVPGA